MRVSLVASGRDEDCGINTYTTALESELDDEVEGLERIGLKSHSTDMMHYLKQGIAAARSDADIIHIQHEYGVFGPKSVGSWLFMIPLVLGRIISDKTIIITMHNSWNEHTPTPPLRLIKILYINANNKILEMLADKFIFLTEDCAEEFAVSVPNIEPEIIKHGVPTSGSDFSKEEAKDEFGIRPEKRLIVEPGYVREAKGHHLFVEIAKELPDHEFLIAGGPRTSSTKPYFEKIKSNAPENVTVTGVLDDETFQRAFAAADLCLLPYSKASQSGIVNWAVRYELPIVGSEIGYFEDLAATNEFIRTLDIDSEAAPDWISELLEDEETLEAMRDDAKEYYKKNNMREVAKQHRSIYENAINAKNRKQAKRRI